MKPLHLFRMPRSKIAALSVVVSTVAIGIPGSAFATPIKGDNATIGNFFPAGAAFWSDIFSGSGAYVLLSLQTSSGVNTYINTPSQLGTHGAIFFRHNNQGTISDPDGGTAWMWVNDTGLHVGQGSKPGGGSWQDSSDIRLKKEVEPLEGALDRLLQLRGVTYKWIEPEKHGNLRGRETGMIAQDVERVFPEWVGTDPDGFKTLGFRGFEALSVEAMRTLQKENETLRSQVSRLEDRIKKLETGQGMKVAGFLPGTLGAGAAAMFAFALLFASKRSRRTSTMASEA